MPFWMIHPQHGEMPVYDRGEVERNEKFGWTLLNEGPAPDRKKPEPEAPADVVEAQEVSEEKPARRKPGPKPKAK